jgi:prepilin-type processing-associated H-X9-DG protein
MQKPSPASAFTLLEVLVVIFIAFVLFAMLQPSIYRKPPGLNLNVRCLSNQKQIALGLIMYEDDHHGEFPWQGLNTNGAVSAFIRDGRAASQFKVLSNYLNYTQVFLCPSDHKRNTATNFAAMTDTTTSYFVGFGWGTNQTETILTGDRHLISNGRPVPPGLLTYSNGSVMNWSRELHANMKMSYGNLSFADGHAQGVGSAGLTSIFSREGLATNLLAVP